MPSSGTHFMYLFGSLSSVLSANKTYSVFKSNNCSCKTAQMIKFSTVFLRYYVISREKKAPHDKTTQVSNENSGGSKPAFASMLSGLEVIKYCSCSTQLSTNLKAFVKNTHITQSDLVIQEE